MKRLVVVVLMVLGALLAGVLVPRVRAEMLSQRQERVRSALRAIHSAEQAYRQLEGTGPKRDVGWCPLDGRYGTLDDLVRAGLLDPELLARCDGYSFVASPSVTSPDGRWFALATPIAPSQGERPWIIGQIASDRLESQKGDIRSPCGDLYFPCEIHGPVTLDPTVCKMDGVVAVMSSRMGHFKTN